MDIFKETLFHKKVAVITGGAQGIGKVIAETFLKLGGLIAVIDNDAEALADFLKENHETSSQILTIQTDIASEKEVSNSIEKIHKHFGKINFLVNNAGVFYPKPIVDLSLNEWNRIIAINLSSIFLYTKLLIPYFDQKEPSAIVNIASTRAFMSEPNTESYSATKGGIVALTHSLAISLGPKIRVNSIAPGWIDVSNFKKFSERKKQNLTAADHKQHPVGRVGIPQDVAALVMFLLSEAASFITGQNFVIDGGMTKKMIYV